MFVPVNRSGEQLQYNHQSIVKATGLLWWNKYSFYILDEPLWTLLKVENNNLDKKDEAILRELLQ